MIICSENLMKSSISYNIAKQCILVSLHFKELLWLIDFVLQIQVCFKNCKKIFRSETINKVKTMENSRIKECPRRNTKNNGKGLIKIRLLENVRLIHEYTFCLENKFGSSFLSKLHYLYICLFL